MIGDPDQSCRNPCGTAQRNKNSRSLFAIAHFLIDGFSYTGVLAKLALNIFPNPVIETLCLIPGQFVFTGYRFHDPLHTVPVTSNAWTISQTRLTYRLSDGLRNRELTFVIMRTKP